MVGLQRAGWRRGAILGVSLLQAGTPTPGVGVDELVDYGPVLVRIGWFFVGLFAVLLVGWFVLTPLVTRVVRRRNRNNPTIDDAVARYVRLGVVVVALLVGAGTAGFGYVLGDSALVVAAATLAIGVAGQTIIGSIVSGIVLVTDPEFNVGDFIRWEDGEGTIQSITLRVTRVLTPAGELVTVPNTVLTGGSITRPFGERRHRIVDRIGLSYDEDLDRAIELLEATANDLDLVATAPSPRVYVEAFEADDVRVTVHYWIERPNQVDVLAARSAFTRAVKQRFDANDVEIGSTSLIELQGEISVADANGPDHGD